MLDIAKLAKRCGLRPADADAHLDFHDDRPDGKTYILSFVFSGDYEQANMERFLELLDMKGVDHIWVDDAYDLEDRVERALSLAPRARTTGR